jgi:hypothetical protein
MPVGARRSRAPELEMFFGQDPLGCWGFGHLLQHQVGEYRFGDPRRGLPLTRGETGVQVGELPSEACFAHGLNLAVTWCGCVTSATIFISPASNSMQYILRSTSLRGRGPGSSAPGTTPPFIL